MRKNSYLIMSVAAVTALTSCKKLGDLSADNFTVTPTPLEAVLLSTVNSPKST